MAPGNVIDVFDPTAEATAGQARLSPRLDTLAGKTLGVIWNGRPLGTEILNAATDLLDRRHGLGRVVFRAKPYIGNIAPPEILDAVGGCDAVIAGVGD